MDYKTKAYYRNKIKEISKRTKISELYITQKALELAQTNANNVKLDSELSIKEQQKNKESHIGYYLISKGINELYKTLQTNKKPKQEKNNLSLYILSITILSIIISGLISYYMFKQTNIVLGIITFLLTFIPASQIATEVIQCLLNKIVKPSIIPKMDFSDGIPEECSTMVIIPSILKSPNKVKDLVSKLEVFYLANKTENLYFTLLGDASESSNETEEIDEEIIKTGIEEIERLNKKYPNNGMGKFQFIYRKREWNDKEGCYLGWERKRGMINRLKRLSSWKNRRSI